MAYKIILVVSVGGSDANDLAGAAAVNAMVLPDVYDSADLVTAAVGEINNGYASGTSASVKAVAFEVP